MVDDHEGLADQHLLAVAELDQRRDVLGVERQRLLDQHMLAGLGRLGRPFDMLRGRQRDVDAVDRVRGEQLLVGAEGMRRAEAVGQRPGLGQVAAGDRRQHAVLGLDDRRNDLIAPDLGRRQNTPAEHVSSPSFDRRRNLSALTAKRKAARRPAACPERCRRIRSAARRRSASRHSRRCGRRAPRNPRRSASCRPAGSTPRWRSTSWPRRATAPSNTSNTETPVISLRSAAGRGARQRRRPRPPCRRRRRSRA